MAINEKSKRNDERFAPAGKLLRVEMIFTQALEEDFLEAFKEHKVAGRYTKLANVMGA